MKLGNFMSIFSKKRKNNIPVNDGNYYLKEHSSAKDKIKDNEYLRELFEEWDEVGSIPYDVGVWIESLINDPSVMVGIHRTAIDTPDSPLDSSMVHAICEEGLYNQGHLMSSGAFDALPNPNLTISPLNNMLNAVIMMKSRYKNSNGGFIMCFPSDLVDQNGDLVGEQSSDIYYDNNGITTIKPEYILGFLGNENGVCTFYPREQILNHEMGRAR